MTFLKFTISFCLPLIFFFFFSVFTICQKGQVSFGKESTASEARTHSKVEARRLKEAFQPLRHPGMTAGWTVVTQTFGRRLYVA